MFQLFALFFASMFGLSMSNSGGKAAKVPVADADSPEDQEPQSNASNDNDDDPIPAAAPDGGQGSGTPDEPDAPNAPNAPTPSIKDPTPTPDGGQSTGDVGEPTLVTSLARGGSTEVVGGRVSTLEIQDLPDGSTVRILEDPSHGNVTVNPDNTLALVLTGETKLGSDSFKYEVTHSDGSVDVVTSNISVQSGPQAAGWGMGEFYTLKTDADGDSIIEHGDNHRKIYVSESEDALSLEDVAALHGITVADMGPNHIRWLEEHPQYGGSEDMALKTEVAMPLWSQLTDGEKAGPTSNWLLFERGFEYDDVGAVITEGLTGESELHPVHVTAWGDGDAPIVNGNFNAFKAPTENVVVTDLYITKSIFVDNSANWLIEDMYITGHEEVDIQDSVAVTLRDSYIMDVYRTEPEKITSTGKWEPVSNRLSGYFSKGMEGLLLEGNTIGYNGWDPTFQYDMSINGGHPPSFYSHNIYIQNDNVDVTIRDNIVFEGASTGIMFRSGGVLEDNVILNNNIGVLILGGDYKDAGLIGNYSLVMDNVITSGAHRLVENKQGFAARGFEDISSGTTMLDNIIAHMIDPNNPDEWLEKSSTPKAYAMQGTDQQIYDDTIIYNWVNETAGEKGNYTPDTNTEGLNTDVLDATTIQKFTAALLGDPDATIGDLADVLRAQGKGELDEVVDADLIISFFQTGFGITPDLGTLDNVRFVPNALGDGVRWDNRLNWTGEALPDSGDSVDLAGNWVNYSGTTTLDNLELGDGAKFAVSQGFLDVNGTLGTGEGSQILVDRAGQFWTDGYGDSDELQIGATGGRFANTGLFNGDADVAVTENAQAILATGGAEFVQSKDALLSIEGGDAKVGFDGTGGGRAILALNDTGVLRFVAEDNAIGSIEEFRSGAFGDSPNVNSGVDLGGSKLVLDVNELSGTGSHTLISADALTGAFDEIEISGLGPRDADIVVDYANDTVTLKLVGDGTGKTELSIEGLDEGSDENDSLWAALTAGFEPIVDDATVEELEYLDVA